jgi:hypothetical protein
MSQEQGTQAQPAERQEARLYVPDSLAATLPAMVRHSLAKLPAERQAEFLELYRKRAKSTAVGYLLWFIAWHYAYVGKWGVQFLFWFTLGGLFVWWLVDAFRIPGLVRQYNEDVAVSLMRDLAIMAQAG